jgi:transglutaminase-like putative cysteine protease
MLKKVYRQWDWVAGINLILIIFLSAYSLELTYWTYNLNRVTALSLLGLLIGFILGFSSFKENLVKLLSGLYGIVFLFLQIVISINNSSSWLDRVNSYIFRFSTSLYQLINNIPLEDGIIFLTVAGFLYCFLSINIGFRFIRLQNSWGSFLAIVFFFYLIQFYLPESQRNYIFISLYTFLILVYIGRQHFLNRKHNWEISGYKVDKDISNYLTKIISIFAFILILFSWGLPLIIQKISGSQIIESNLRNQRDYSTSWSIIQNFFYPLRQQNGFGEGNLPEVLALGTSRSQKNDQVLKIKVPYETTNPNPFYWKGRAYDYYENGIWQSKNVTIQHFMSIDEKPYITEKSSTGLFSFTYSYPREIIFTPQITLQVKHEADLIFFPINSERQDILSIVDNQLIHKDETIEIIGGYYNPDWESLLNSSPEFPEWVSNNYLQLPKNFSEKISELARDISLSKKTRIEKALVITNYLRNMFRYKDSVDIPEGSDPIEWFLFESREGFCNYFSTAEVLMLRSIGIPARIVVGYAQGERISDESEFLVRIKDSHSWVEAYFSGSGWIILEPTPSQPNIDYNKPPVSNEAEGLGREEKIFLDNANETQNPDLKLFSGINERYGITTKNVERKNSFGNNLFRWIITIGVIGSLFLSLAVGIFIRKKPISFPIIIQKNFEIKGKKIPKWIDKWADFEKLPDFQKRFLKLRLLTIILLFKIDKNLTPKEFFNQMSLAISPEKDLVKIVSDLYQQLAYGFFQETSSDIYDQYYNRLVILILRKWWKNRIREFKSRIVIGGIGQKS